MSKEIKPGVIVQLDPEKTGNPMFAACLMVVTEMKSWGVQGYVQTTGQNGKPGGQAYYRAKFGTFLPVQDNCAPWVIGNEEDDALLEMAKEAENEPARNFDELKKELEEQGE